ncbi:ChrR family anti-sigma-E factor [Pelagibius sp.]|uniref:ChrR family anti-sigma-E factor n=1 Tax=Pelagibius sp. TaxID=1931238 RepID=UPI003B50B079
MPKHHLSEEILMAYAAGSLPEALSLVVASHLTLCPICRAEVEAYEALGGSLMDALDPASLDESAFSSIMAEIDMLDGEAEEGAPWGGAMPAPHRPALEDPSLPRPLRDYLQVDLATLQWRKVMRGVEDTEITLGQDGAKTRLMRIQPGVAVPKHTHHGQEVTLVLEGGYSDGDGHYERGDVQIADPSVDHQPVADQGEPCICLVVSDAPMKMTGTFGRLLNPFVTY